MTSQHDKPMRWRPRFSVRTLVIVVTLVCCYAACWGPTKTQGVQDVLHRASREMGFDWAEDVPASSFFIKLFDASPTMPLVVDLSTPPYHRRDYYFWFFGYVVKLPFEREFQGLPPPSSEPTNFVIRS